MNYNWSVVQIMKFFVMKKTTVWFCVLTLILCSLVSMPIGENVVASVFFGDNLRKVPVYSVQTDEKTVAISFDAAWGADKTQGIMDILKQHNVSATFFLVGFWVEHYPDLVKKIAENGFEIGNHSNTHPDFTKLSREQMKLELETCINLIKKITDADIKLFRSPYGAYNNASIEVAQSLGMLTIQWDVDSLDWKGISAKEICSRVLSKVKNGSIILFHNNSDYILEALPIVLDRLILKGYKIVNIGSLVSFENYEINRAGVQKKL